MDKSQLKYYSQITKLCIMVLLLLITPFLPTSMRPPYLYFLLNLLIIAVGAEAGLLSSFKPPEEYYKKHQPAVLVNVAPPKPIINTATTSLVDQTSPNINNDNQLAGAELGHHDEGTERKVMKRMEKSVSEKINIVRVVKVRKVKKCPSMPSLFFIGGGEADHVEDRATKVVVEEDVEEEEEDEEVEDALSGQELFTKAETFIGNFYKQLKMQREDSWKRLHDFYHKAF